MTIRLSKTKYYKVANYFESYEEFKVLGHEALKGDVKPLSIEEGAVGEERMADMPDNNDVIFDSRRIYREKLDLCAKLIYNII